MFKESVEYNEDNLDIAENNLQSFGSDMGGTEIY